MIKKRHVQGRALTKLLTIGPSVYRSNIFFLSLHHTIDQVIRSIFLSLFLSFYLHHTIDYHRSNSFFLSKQLNDLKSNQRINCTESLRNWGNQCIQKTQSHKQIFKIWNPNKIIYKITKAKQETKRDIKDLQTIYNAKKDTFKEELWQSYWRSEPIDYFSFSFSLSPSHNRSID